MVEKLNALSRGSLILVTGANGYIGSNVVDCLLQLGFRVRGTVRSPKPWLDQLFQEKYGVDAFESTIVPSLEDETVIKSAMINVSGVMHVASDVSFEKDPTLIIGRVVNLTKAVLSAASKTTSVKRFVMTSSSAAVIIPKPNEPGKPVDQDSWNDESIKAAWDPNTPENRKGVFIYAASKTEAERQAWAWVRENKPGFSFNTVLPNWTIGENLSPKIPGSSNGLIRNLINGDTHILDIFTPQHYVNVKDVARLHAIALLAPKVDDERIFAMAKPFRMTDVIFLLREMQPNNPKIPGLPVDEGYDLTEVVEASKAEILLREYFGQACWTSLEDSLRAGINGYECLCHVGKAE